jgi:hypothetical protein
VRFAVRASSTCWAPRQKWLQTRERAARKRELRLRAGNTAECRIRLGGLRGDLVTGHAELGLHAAQLSARLLDLQPIRFRVDGEQHLAGVHQLVVADIEADDTAADVGRHMNQVRLQIGIVGARTTPEALRRQHSQHDQRTQHRGREQNAKKLPQSRHGTGSRLSRSLARVFPPPQPGRWSSPLKPLRVRLPNSIPPEPGELASRL